MLLKKRDAKHQEDLVILDCAILFAVGLEKKNIYTGGELNDEERQ